MIHEYKLKDVVLGIKEYLSINIRESDKFISPISRELIEAVDKYLKSGEKYENFVNAVKSAPYVVMVSINKYLEFLIGEGRITVQISEFNFDLDEDQHNKINNIIDNFIEENARTNEIWYNKTLKKIVLNIFDFFVSNNLKILNNSIYKAEVIKISDFHFKID